MFNTILVCTDGSEHALQAVRKAASLAKQADTCILLLHVNDMVKELAPYVMPWQLELGEAQSEPDGTAEQKIILQKTAALLEEPMFATRCCANMGIQHPESSM